MKKRTYIIGVAAAVAASLTATPAAQAEEPRNATPGCVSISEFRAVHSRPNHSPRVSWTRREFNWFVGATPLRWGKPFAAQEQDVPVKWRYAHYRACYDLPGVPRGRSVVEVQYLKSRHLPGMRRYTTADIFHW